MTRDRCWHTPVQTTRQVAVLFSDQSTIVLKNSHWRVTASTSIIKGDIAAGLHVELANGRYNSEPRTKTDAIVLRQRQGVDRFMPDFKRSNGRYNSEPRTKTDALLLLFCVNGRVWTGLCLISSVQRFKRYHTIARAIVRSQNALNATEVDCRAIQRPIVTDLEQLHFCGSSANSFLHDKTAGVPRKMAIFCLF
jgi:hypothetical protein